MYYIIINQRKILIMKIIIQPGELLFLGLFCVNELKSLCYTKANVFAQRIRINL